MFQTGPPLGLVSVGIVTYNNAQVIERTLTSLAEADSGGLTVELLVRDNGSSDGTPALLARLQSQIDNLRILPGGQNVGYGRGHNDILSQASGDVYVICNPDIVVGHKFFLQSVAFLRSHQDAGLMSPRMTFADGTLQHSNRQHPTLLDLALRRFLPSSIRAPFKNRLAHYEMADRGYDSSYDVPFCSGALMVCRVQALHAVGGFDDRYFLYFEDADLSRELQRAGWRTVYCPDVSVVHGWQRSAHKSWRMMIILVRNAVRYFNKWGWKVV